jgi:hypothetical protein
MAPSKPCEELAQICEQALDASGGEKPVAVELRLAVRQQPNSANS